MEGNQEQEKKDNGLSIIIENYEFTLIYKTIAYETGVYEPKYNLPPIVDELSRIVKIKSVNLDTKDEEFFWTYLSLSELGVWRFLCYDNPKSNRYDKGKEYIQSTCINIYLQQHIHLCYDRLDEIVSPHEDIRVFSRSVPGFVSVIEKNINITQQYINKHSFILHDSKREKYILDNPNIRIKCGNTTRNTEESIIRQIQDTSNYLEANYIILEHEEIFRYNFIFRDVINSENIMMKVTLKDKHSDETIIMFYKKMFFSKLNSVVEESREQTEYNDNISKITNDGNEHFVVILVIPSTANCLSNSLYTEYIHLGIFVCKPFEYTSSINSRKTRCTKDYSYVGYRYVNIFPIKNIESGLVTDTGNINQKQIPEEKPDLGGRKIKTNKRTKASKKRKTIKKRKWSRKYKLSINCRRPKGFSQKQYCKYGRNKK